MTSPLGRREFLLGTAGALGLLATRQGAAFQGLGKDGRKPDILFIFADDHAFNSIRALGCDEVHTPHLDKLVRRGVSFTNCYNQGGWHGAVCVASRTMLLTGRFLWDAKALDSTMQQECDAGRLWPQHLERDGYRTYMSGKWHVNCPASEAFQVAHNIRPGMPPDIPAQYDRPKADVPDPFDPTDPELGGFWTGGVHWSETLGDDGVAFLQDAARHEAPFFIYLAFNAPHDPRQSPREYVDRYPPDTVRVPDSFMPEYPDKEAIGCGPGLRDERLAPFPRTEQAVRVQRGEYYAIISHMDAQIGRILDALEASGRADSTHIIFTADHGLAVGHHGLMGKQNMYEHSMKAPLVLSGPGIPADRRIHTPVYLQDVVPTTLDLAGMPVPEYIQYKSLLPLVTGAVEATHDVIYGAYILEQRMVRVGRHKLIHYPKVERFLLFDLEADPAEMNDLAGDPQHAALLEQLKGALVTRQRKMGDPLYSAPL